MELVVELEKLQKENEILRLRKENAELREQLGIGEFETTAWLKERTKLSRLRQIKECILFPFRDELEGKCVYYPNGNGEHWRFNKYTMNHWLNDNFHRIDFKKARNRPDRFLDKGE